MRAHAPRSIMLLPLALLLGLLAISVVTGRAPIPVAIAADTVTITGQVDEFVYLDPTGCASATTLDIGELVPGDPWTRTSSDCAITFGTSNAPAGAELYVLEDPVAPASPPGAMKCIVASCTTGGADGDLTDVAANSAPPTGNASAFGGQLESATLGATAGAWTVGNANPIDAASVACRTATVGDGLCNFRFGASALSTDGPGAYRAQVQFLVLPV